MIWSSESIDSVGFLQSKNEVFFCSPGGTVFGLQYIMQGPWNTNISFLIWFIISVFSIITVFFTIYCLYISSSENCWYLYILTFPLTPTDINLPHHCKFTLNGPPVRNIWLILMSSLCKSTDIIIYLSQSFATEANIAKQKLDRPVLFESGFWSTVLTCTL